jgi:hypothetical protein
MAGGCVWVYWRLVFGAAVYVDGQTAWMPKHFENICSAINQLPSESNFDVLPLSEATWLSQVLGSLMQSDGSCASIPDERGSQSSNAEQQAVTPGTSFSAKRRKG